MCLILLVWVRIWLKYRKRIVMYNAIICTNVINPETQSSGVGKNILQIPNYAFTIRAEEEMKVSQVAAYIMPTILFIKYSIYKK